MCGTCPHREPYQVGPWFGHLWFLYELQQGGYPFARNDLDLDEWRGLAQLKAALEAPPPKDD